MKTKNKVVINWSHKFAYAIGLLATDGNLSSDGRHIDLSSTDKEQLENFKKCLHINNKITTKKSGAGNKCLRIQIGDINFYKFLLKIGLTPRKSKTIAELAIPNKYFFDFLRGHLDGDGTFYYYYDPRWKSSFMFYMCFYSASNRHILWLRQTVLSLLGISGHIFKPKKSSVFQLRYAKKESVVLIKKLYYNDHVVCLSRKQQKIKKALKISAGGEMVYTYA